MKKYLVSYANEGFYKKQKRLNKSAIKFGIDKVISYTDKDLKQTDFYNQNKKILDEERGAGYWFWKPYVILKAMEKISEGDILFYVDSGAEFISSISPLTKLCKEQGGILLFNGNSMNKFWTKRDCFIKMDCDSKRYREGFQSCGGYQVYIKNKKSMEFLNNFLTFAKLPGMIDDAPSKEPNFEGFIEHRHDQSILSNLAIKYDIKKFRNPSQGGNHLKKQGLRKKGEWLKYPYTYSDTPDEKSNYPTIFYNRRSYPRPRLFFISLHSKLPLKLKLIIKDFLK